MPRISVVLPVYRTAPYVRELYHRLVATLEPITTDFELLMIDDGSPDQAWDIISEIARSDSRLKAIRLSRNFGQHPAIAAGFEHCTGDIVVLMDADLQDRPEDIPLLLQHLTDDVDVVYTTKRQSREPLLTRWTSRWYHRVLGRLTGIKEPENIGTFRLFTRRFLEGVLAYPERNILYGPLMFHAGFRSAVVSVEHPERRGTGSSYSFRRRLSLAINSLISYTELPQRFLVTLGGLVLLGTVLYAVALVVGWLLALTSAPPGITLLALLITLSLGVTMMGLGIIGMYVFRVYQEVLRRPRYIIARSINVVRPSGTRPAGPAPEKGSSRE